MEKSPKSLKRFALIEDDNDNHGKIKKIKSEENFDNSGLNIPTYSDMICHAIR